MLDSFRKKLKHSPSKMDPSSDGDDSGGLQELLEDTYNQDLSSSPPSSSVVDLIQSVLRALSNHSALSKLPPGQSSSHFPFNSSDLDLFAALHPSSSMVYPFNFTSAVTTTTTEALTGIASTTSNIMLDVGYGEITDYDEEPELHGNDHGDVMSCSGLNAFMPALPWIRITFGVLMILENCLSLAALGKVRRMPQAVHNFITSLVVAEFLMGLWCCYRYGADISLEEGGVDWECKLRFVGNTYLNFVAILSVVGLCVDRCIALYRPFQYMELVSTKRLRLGLAAIWIAPVVLVTIAYMDTVDDSTKTCTFVHTASRRTYIVLTVSRCVMISIIIVAELFIFHLARCQIVKIHPNMYISSRNTSRIARMNFKAAITTLAVVVPFLLLYIPVLLVQGHLAIVSRSDGDCLSQLLSLVWLIASAHGLLTPIVFCWRFTEVRRNLLAILFCRKDLRLRESNYSVRAGSQRQRRQIPQRQYPQEIRNAVSETERRSSVFQITKPNDDPESAVTV